MVSIAIIIFAILIFGSLLFILLLILSKPYLGTFRPKKRYLLTKTESFFFNYLKKAISPYDYICPKIRVADLIHTNISPKQYQFWKYQRQINQKHIDFLICDSHNFYPKLVIELDDRSHLRKDRITRDGFLNKAFKSAGVPILHIKTAKTYNLEIIKKLIEDKLKS